MKDEDPDTVFAWCWFFSFVVGCFLASALTLCLLPVSTGKASYRVAVLCYFAFATIFVLLLIKASDKVVPNPRRK